MLHQLLKDFLSLEPPLVVAILECIRSVAEEDAPVRRGWLSDSLETVKVGDLSSDLQQNLTPTN